MKSSGNLKNFLIAKNLKTIKHGFFGRTGGSSKGIYSSLNVSYNSGDNPENIKKNRDMVSESLGVIDHKIYYLNQQHTNKVIVFDKQTEKSDIEIIAADAFVTNRENTGVGIVTADCAPILAYEPDSGFIAGIHAGWKGALAGICENTVLKLQENNVDITKLAVAIGPCISKKNYEVKENFMKVFLKKNSSFKTYFEKKGGKIYFDLPEFVRNRFEILGVCNIEILGNCTYYNNNMFYSNRRTHKTGESDFGRMASIISL